MFCKKCGAEISDNDSFCKKCGQAIENQNIVNETRADKKRILAFYLSLLTSPFLFILRMLTQESVYIPAGVGGGWKGRTSYFVPDNIKAIMIVLLVIVILFVLDFRKPNSKEEKNFSRITNLIMLINSVISFCIIFAK